MMRQNKKALIIATIGGFLSVTEINNARLLQKLGFEVHYAANRKLRNYEFEEQELIDMGIVLHQVDFSKNPFDFAKLGKCIKELKRLIDKEKFDVIHCHTPVGGVAGRMAAYISKIGKQSSPYIMYTAHGFHFYNGAPVLNWIIYYPVEYLLSCLTDCLVTINQEDYERAKRMLCKNCVQIPGVGIDLRRFCPSEKVYREKIGTEKFRIISVGELNKNKNHSIVIQALALLQDKDITYEIYGNGPFKEALEANIRHYGLETQVSLKGFHMHIEEVLLQADCCIFPSIREGLGLAALEAMACKIPLIVSDNRGVREFAEHGKNCIVCQHNNAKQFAEAILHIKRDKVFAKGLTEYAYETVQKFSVQESTKVMRNVYEKI